MGPQSLGETRVIRSGLLPVWRDCARTRRPPPGYKRESTTPDWVRTPPTAACSASPTLNSQLLLQASMDVIWRSAWQRNESQIHETGRSGRSTGHSYEAPPGPSRPQVHPGRLLPHPRRVERSDGIRNRQATDRGRRATKNWSAQSSWSRLPHATVVRSGWPIPALEHECASGHLSALAHRAFPVRSTAVIACSHKGCRLHESSSGVG